MAVHLETVKDARMRAADRDRLTQHLNLAEQLGGETAVLPAAEPVDEVLRYAHHRNVNRIIVGKPSQPIWRELISRPFVYELTRRCGDIDIYVISGDDESQNLRTSRNRQPTSSRLDYLWAVLAVALCTVFCWVLWSFVAPNNLVNLAMIYLLGVVGVSMRLGRGPSSLAAVLSVATFDFCFVPPYFTFAVTDVQYLLTFAVMLLTGLIISTLTGRLNFQVDTGRTRARRLAALFALSRELASLQTRKKSCPTAVRHITDAVDADVLVLLPNARRKFESPQTAGGPVPGQSPVGREAGHNPTTGPLLTEHERGVAEWVLNHAERRGVGNRHTGRRRLAVLAVAVAARGGGCVEGPTAGRCQTVPPGSSILLNAMSSLVVLALERVHWAATAERTRLEIEGSACGIRCSRPCRTTCVRRWRPFKAPAARLWRWGKRSMRLRAASWRRRFWKNQNA